MENTGISPLGAALSLHRQGKLSEAEDAYRQILETNSFEPHALHFLGILVMSRGVIDEAEALFSRHLSIDPAAPFTLHQLGRIRQLQQRHREAVEFLMLAATALPTLAPVFNDLATALNQLGRRDEALAALDRALEIDPKFGVAHDNRGLILLEGGFFATAIAAFQAALAHIPPDASNAQRVSILQHLAEACYEAGDLTASGSTCDQILSLENQNEETLVFFAKILLHQGREQEALKHLNRLARFQGLEQEGKRPSPEATVLLLGAVGAAHVPTRYLFDPALFNTLSVTLVSPGEPDAPLGGIPYDSLTKADLVFSTLGDADRFGGQGRALNRLLKQLGIPIINPPDRVSRTGREQAKALFGEIAGQGHVTRTSLNLKSHHLSPIFVVPSGVLALET